MKLTKTIREQADETRELTIAEAKALPGLLGIIASAMLKAHGFYGYTDVANGGARKVLLIAK